MRIHLDPSPETLANRKAGMELLQDRANHGSVIDLQTLDLMRVAEPFFVNTTVDYADDDDGWDDVRPF